MRVGKENINTLAYIPLHYGKEYLEAVIKSIHPFVDRVVAFYSSEPTYGHKGNLANPDSKEELERIVNSFTRTEFIDITNRRITRENIHRNLAHTYASSAIQNPKDLNFDLVMAVDADEVWNPERVEEAIHAAYFSNSHFIHVAGSQWYHFWKGLKEVNRDGFYPMRFTNLNNYVGNADIIEAGEIYHMGYAIDPEVMKYKLSCHGHKSEISNGWYNDKWLNYERGVTTHLHPASRDIWIETEDFNGKLPDYL
jgi:hypothetical protein